MLITLPIYCLHAIPQNFLALCASGYYNDCPFHRYAYLHSIQTHKQSVWFHSRNIKDFMVQTGDPTGTGKGGTSIWGRKFEDEFHETLKVRHLLIPVQYNITSTIILQSFQACIHCLGCKQAPASLLCLTQHNTRGVVSMANSGPDTNGSQFFIIYSKQPHLDMKYTTIGK